MTTAGDGACSPRLTENGPHTVQVYCETHESAQVAWYTSSEDAFRAFACDNGQGWRFLLNHRVAGEEEIPLLADLSQLRTWVRRAAEEPDDAELVVWRWLKDAEFDPVVISRAPAGENPGGKTFDYVLSAPDGAEYTRLTITVP